MSNIDLTIMGTFTYSFVGFNEQYKNVLGYQEGDAFYDESSVKNSDDMIVGSLRGGNTHARGLGGDDYFELSSGFNNVINGNIGRDTINLFDYGGGANGHILGGADNDTINIYSGSWLGGPYLDNPFVRKINGNNGDDIITNYALANNVRGGAGNDVITNKGSMTAWGDLGADTFIPYASDGHMVIMDFNAQEGDIIDFSGLGVYKPFYYDSNKDGLTDTAFESANGSLAAIVYSNVL